MLNSVKTIERQYRTGEEPVLVMCSDMSTYICKYVRSAAPAYKLACEFIGATMAKAWQIETPNISFVHIRQEHWAGRRAQHHTVAPALGSKQIERVVDVTPSTYYTIKATLPTLRQIMKIALFDFWMANEDRNANNANLLYKVENEKLVSIDYGCIFNTATFDFPLSQLTMTDTILWSELFQHLLQGKGRATIDKIASELHLNYADYLKHCQKQVRPILEELPQAWNVPTQIVAEKLQELFTDRWIKSTVENFMECLTENYTNYEQSEI